MFLCFLLGVSLTINFILIFVISLLYKRLSKKITPDDIEEYILNNYMEVGDNL